MNFKQTLSLWDYIFGSAYILKNGKNIEIEFKGDENFPENFRNQLIFPSNHHNKRIQENK